MFRLIFTQWRGILDTEEEKVLQKLKREEEDGLQTLAVSENELIQQNEWVTELISDVEHLLEGSTMEMLQDVNTIMRRCKLLTMKKAIPFPKKAQTVFPITGLRERLQGFQELTDARQYWVHMRVTTNDDSRIDISKDQRKIRYQYTPVFFTESFSVSRDHYFPAQNVHNQVLGFSQNAFQLPGNNLPLLGVLGALIITSGKHYWEVSVSKKTSWHLGLRMENKSEYKAFREGPTTHSPLSLPLSLPIALEHVGVFVDYQAGSVSFYSTTYNAFLIYKSTNCAFTREVYPYFNPTKCSEPMTLC
ncbi:LOW QUALITY PROTEIN: tripartite motif-containing protein 5-like [Dipodomys spectabilis]|uniref:LOW QUALITY PROTEIN: tripartite motif-containing protein 5-like n=1 Tax=Dipodomys spectabilis TaxID=105255 RepID=UPI001C53A296|nr:LOW QUALITY PROTEIN: tripartite motif-containing protein 5-like [Dipodomys spectabilis]